MAGHSQRLADHRIFGRHMYYVSHLRATGLSWPNERGLQRHICFECYSQWFTTAGQCSCSSLTIIRLALLKLALFEHYLCVLCPVERRLWLTHAKLLYYRMVRALSFRM
jgi:hypothetical protein